VADMADDGDTNGRVKCVPFAAMIGGDMNRLDLY
jgi:hypothetical protein